MLITQIKFDDLYNNSNFPKLIEEYAEECKIKGLPPINVKVETYRHYEAVGAVYIIAALNEELLTGFAIVLSPVMPHFSCLVSVCESIFVAKEFRNSSTGLKLIKECERHAKELGSPGLLVSAPVGSILEELLPKIEYEKTNVVFFRKFTDE